MLLFFTLVCAYFSHILLLTMSDMQLSLCANEHVSFMPDTMIPGSRCAWLLK